MKVLCLYVLLVCVSFCSYSHIFLKWLLVFIMLVAWLVCLSCPVPGVLPTEWGAPQPADQPVCTRWPAHWPGQAQALRHWAHFGAADGPHCWTGCRRWVCLTCLTRRLQANELWECDSKDTTQLDSDWLMNNISLVYCCCFSLHSNYLKCLLCGRSLLKQKFTRLKECLYFDVRGRLNELFPFCWILLALTRGGKR